MLWPEWCGSSNEREGQEKDEHLNRMLAMVSNLCSTKLTFDPDLKNVEKDNKRGKTNHLPLKISHHIKHFKKWEVKLDYHTRWKKRWGGKEANAGSWLIHTHTLKLSLAPTSYPHSETLTCTHVISKQGLSEKFFLRTLKPLCECDQDISHDLQAGGKQ